MKVLVAKGVGRGQLLARYFACVMGLGLAFGGSSAMASFADEHPYAAHHIDDLPKEMRRSVASLAKACGRETPAATHYFSVFISGAGQQFHALHYDRFACEKRGAICKPHGCLHEVYLRKSGRQNLVFRAYAQDIRLTNHDGDIALEVFVGMARQHFVWDGRRFTRAKQ